VTEDELQIHTGWLTNSRVIYTHTGRQNHAAGEYHGATILIKTPASSQFSVEAKIAFFNGFVVQLLTHQKNLYNDGLPPP